MLVCAPCFTQRLQKYSLLSHFVCSLVPVTPKTAQFSLHLPVSPSLLWYSSLLLFLCEVFYWLSCKGDGVINLAKSCPVPSLICLLTGIIFQMCNTVSAIGFPDKCMCLYIVFGEIIDNNKTQTKMWKRICYPQKQNRATMKVKERRNIRPVIDKMVVLNRKEKAKKSTSASQGHKLLKAQIRLWMQLRLCDWITMWLHLTAVTRTFCLWDDNCVKSWLEVVALADWRVSQYQNSKSAEGFPPNHKTALTDLSDEDNIDISPAWQKPCKDGQ